MGVWIEIVHGMQNAPLFCVTPFMGVWIEIVEALTKSIESLVTPFMGVWIEIHQTEYHATDISCHSLHGSVD